MCLFNNFTKFRLAAAASRTKRPLATVVLWRLQVGKTKLNFVKTHGITSKSTFGDPGSVFGGPETEKIFTQRREKHDKKKNPVKISEILTCACRYAMLCTQLGMLVSVGGGTIPWALCSLVVKRIWLLELVSPEDACQPTNIVNCFYLLDGRPGVFSFWPKNEAKFPATFFWHPPKLAIFLGWLIRFSWSD